MGETGMARLVPFQPFPAQRRAACSHAAPRAAFSRTARAGRPRAAFGAFPHAGIPGKGRAAVTFTAALAVQDAGVIHRRISSKRHWCRSSFSRLGDLQHASQAPRAAFSRTARAAFGALRHAGIPGKGRAAVTFTAALAVQDAGVIHRRIPSKRH